MRPWGFRLAALLLGPALLLLVLEFGSRALVGYVDYPMPGLAEAAQYLHFEMPERLNPLFAPDPESPQTHFATRRALLDGNDAWLVQDQRFPAQRSPEAVRIAFLGGSSVQGWPMRRADAAFAARTGALLAERFPDRRIDVINAGVGAFSSFQLLDIGRQIEAFNPDVVVVYAGHNDQGYHYFHEDFLDSVLDQRGPLSSLDSRLNGLNFWRLARRLRDKRWREQTDYDPDDLWRSERTHDRGDVFQPHDYRGEMGTERYSEFVRLHRKYMVQMLTANLGALVDRLDDADTDVVLGLPASNLRDFRPRVSVFWEPLSAEQQARVEALVTEADEAMDEDRVLARTQSERSEDQWTRYPDMAVPIAYVEWAVPFGSPEARAFCEPTLAKLAEAQSITDRHALSWFLAGTCLVHSDLKAARRAFERARDVGADMPPFQRAGADVIEGMRAFAEHRGLPVLDTPQLLAERAELGIVGSEYFVDNIHFSGLGAQAVAEGFAGLIAQLPVFTSPRPRAPDPPPAETWARLKAGAEEVTWGLGLDMSGTVSAPPVGDLDHGPTPEAGDAP